MASDTPRVESLTMLVFDLFQTHGALVRFGDHFAGSVGLSSSSWQILGAIARGQGQVTVPQIARRMGYARQSIQRQVNNFVDRGLVELRDNPNHRRSKGLELSEAGGQLYAEVGTRWSKWVAQNADAPSVHDVEEARRVLAVLREAMALPPTHFRTPPKGS